MSRVFFQCLLLAILAACVRHELPVDATPISAALLAVPPTDPGACREAGGVWYSLPDICCHQPGRHELDPMDGVVDVNDFLALLRYWGSCPPEPCGCCPGDITRDGVVDNSDFLVILEAWGTSPVEFQRCRELP